ncbi:MAG: HU family DNA-binding protein [bacterium]
MTKADLVKKIADEAEVSKAKAEEVLNAFIKQLTTLLKKGDKLTLPGFGTFYVTKRAAREGINPKTKAKIKIPAKKVPKFRPGSLLKSAVAK